MNIAIPPDLIQEVFELRLPVRAVLNNNLELTGCSLICETGNKKEILVQIGPCDCPEQGDIHLSWTHLSALYSCTCAIVSKEEVDSKIYVRALFPDKIAKEERRKYFRVRPSESRPVLVRFTLADKRVVNIEAVDVSGGGIAFVVPHNISLFQIGDTLFLNIAFPALGEIKSAAVIKDIFRHLNMVRIGMEFLEMPETTQNVVMRYVMIREPEMREESSRIKPSGKPAICFVKESDEHREYEFLAQKFGIVRIDFFNAFSRLIAHPPDLIIVNETPHESPTLLGIISKHKVLKNIPLVLLCRKEKGKDDAQENLFILHLPVSEKLLVKTVENLIEEYRLSKYIQKKRLTVISGKGKKIFILDRNFNISNKSVESLTSCGFEVSIYRFEQGILEKIEKDYPDIILLDEETEKTDPVSLCRLININKTTRAIPKAILTSDAKNFEKFYSQGYFAGFFIKPINTEQLVSRVFELVFPENGNE